jgi:DNA gyrase/topoisomerase IV subunit A
VLLSAYKIAREKLVKSRQVDAYTIGHYHPHGECYGTVVQLVRQGFLIGQGNFGTNVGVEPVGPAAPRYTECRMHPKTIEMAFKYVKHVPWIDTELGDTEPAYLPTMFPICLMGTEYTQGIGFGFKTFIPCYDIKDLYQRLLWLLGIRKRKPTIVPISDCNIIDDKKQLEKLLTTGKSRIEVEGIVEINKRNNTASIKSWPPGKRFQTFLNKFDKELSDGMIGFTDLSVEETNIVFQVIRERNRDKIFEQFLEKLYEVNKGFISFELIVVDTDSKVITKSVDQMLLDTYELFKQTNENMLKHEIGNIDNIIIEYQTLVKIRPVLSRCIGKKMSTDKTLAEIENKTGVAQEVSKGLMSKYKISKLLTIDTDTSDLNKSKKELQHHLATLNEYVLEQYNAF